MKNVLLISIFLLLCAMTCKTEPQVQVQDKATTATFNADVIIQKAAPTLFLKGSGAIINANTGDVTFTFNSNLVTLGGGNLSLGANSLLGTGSIGATGSGKFLKGWFTNLEITNLPTVNGVPLFTNAVFLGGITTPAITLGSTLLTSTATELNNLDGYLGTVTNLNSLTGATSNIQQQINNKPPIDNAHLTGLTIIDQLHIGSSDSALVIGAMENAGVGLTVRDANGNQVPYNNPPENTIAVLDIPEIPTIYSAAGDTSNQPTPGKIGNIYINTSAGKVYISRAATRNGWVILN